jgi:hypothetical protein
MKRQQNSKYPVAITKNLNATFRRRLCEVTGTGAADSGAELWARSNRHQRKQCVSESSVILGKSVRRSCEQMRGSHYSFVCPSGVPESEGIHESAGQSRRNYRTVPDQQSSEETSAWCRRVHDIPEEPCWQMDGRRESRLMETASARDSRL